MSKVSSLLYVALWLGSNVDGAKAQSQFGTITGYVTDPSEAVVSRATVRAANEATNIASSTLTNESGNYVISGLLPGLYTVTVDQSGFKHFRLTGVVVTAGQATGTDIRLELGSTLDSVTVSATAAQLNLESGTVAPSASAQYLDMPATLMQSSQTLADVLVPYLAGQQYTGGRAVTAYGSRTYDRRVNVDGAVFGFGNTSTLRMPRGTVDSLQATSLNADAEHQTSNTNEMTTAKGTNDLHGEIWTELQNQALNSLSWYAPPTRPPGTPTVGYGFVLGGPVYLPKIYNGRNRTFFHITFQKYHLAQPGNSSNTVPTDLMKTGNLSELGTPIIDPLSGTPFANSIIPTNRLSPIGQNILGLYPPANISPTFTLNNSQTPSQYFQPYHDIFLRMDQQLGSKDNVHGTYGYNWQLITESNSGLPASGLDNVLWQSNFVYASENHIFSPTLLNEANFGAKLGYFQSITNTTDGTKLSQSLGLPGPEGTLPSAGQTGGPNINITGLTAFSPEPLGSNTSDRRTYTFRDTLSWTHGRFTMKAGFEYIKYTTTTSSFANLFGTYNFTGQFSGNAIADVLLGLPSSTSRTAPPGPIGQSQSQTGYFVNVDARLTPKLTMNLGLRLQYNTPAEEPSGQYYNFDVRSGDLVVPNQRSLSSINPGLDPSLVAKIVTASSVHFPTRLVNAEMNVNPRLGFAYHIWNNTVVRGGFGSYGGLLGRGAPTGGPFTPGLQNFTNVNNCVGASCVPAFTLANPFPGAGVQAVSGLDVSGVNPYMRVPQTYQWNLTVEERLPANFVLRTTYMGSKSANLAYRRNINLPPASTIPLSQDRLLYPEWYSVTYSDSGGNASYQSWDTQFTRRWENGLTIDGGYSLTKCITDDDEGGLESNNGSYGRLGITIEDPYSRSRDRGNCESIARHRFRTLYVYDLPFGRGRALLKNPQGFGPGLLNALAGGWSVSGFLIASTGRFYTPFWSGFDAANTGQTFIRPDRVCSGVASNQTSENIFNPSCFVQPPAGRYGSAGTGIIQGLGYWRYDAGLYKYFTFGANERIPQFRLGMQSINIFNHPTKNISDTGPFTINSPSTVNRADDIIYDSGVTANLGAARIIFVELRIQW